MAGVRQRDAAAGDEGEGRGEGPREGAGRDCQESEGARGEDPAQRHERASEGEDWMRVDARDRRPHDPPSPARRRAPVRGHGRAVLRRPCEEEPDVRRARACAQHSGRKHSRARHRRFPADLPGAQRSASHALVSHGRAAMYRPHTKRRKFVNVFRVANKAESL